MNTCPTCGQTIPQPQGRRICSFCTQLIGRYHRWQFGTDGRPRHKDCANPEGITPAPLQINLPTQGDTPCPQ